MRAVLLLAIVGCALAFPRGQNRIVGGSETTIEHYPYMSNMQYNWFGMWSQSCGGSLITTTTILSAAHCYFRRYNPSEWRVRLGSSFASSGGTVHEVNRMVVHAGYSQVNLNNDVAIVKLSSPAILSNSIGLASIPGTNYILQDNAVVTAIGWGSLYSGGLTTEELRHVDIHAINQEICAERYAYLKTQPGYIGWPDITPGMLCAGILDVGGKDACQGDSGGPLVHHGYIVVGITSWGKDCADATYPGVNARVSYYSQWIVANA